MAVGVIRARAAAQTSRSCDTSPTRDAGNAALKMVVIFCMRSATSVADPAVDWNWGYACGPVGVTVIAAFLLPNAAESAKVVGVTSKLTISGVFPGWVKLIGLMVGYCGNWIVQFDPSAPR